MLSADPVYEEWVTSEGLDGKTDFHIADSPFLYTNGWDWVGTKYLPDGVSAGNYPFHGAPPSAGSANGASGGADNRDKNMFGEPI
eukprot:CAMPEP_0113662026 /NCGR_PEP_ID=MMETSP0038_2-20120614/329_1 /TAXON_ID=2898 /ORGANISM="Cryptomonas paramecium" /LENGTH=84 /DNA_ID=CAMNT_0000576839 /DNA_START=51 /DNA_END=305 /DNA_ORIENTATION=+ /assembly_acc=CAM_ASM_000170